MYVQFVFVCPQALDAKAQIFHPELPEATGPNVKFAELESVVTGLGEPSIRVPAGADQV